MPRKSLFREIGSLRQNYGMGATIKLNRTLFFNAAAIFSVTIVVAIFLVLRFGSYPRKIAVMGQLMPDGGVVKIIAPQMGVITKRMFLEGQHVKKGDRLFELSNERFNERGDAQNNINREIVKKGDRLLLELNASRQINVLGDIKSKKRVVNVEEELKAVQSQIEIIKRREALAAQTVKKYRDLFKEDLVSDEHVQSKVQDHMEIATRLASVHRERAALLKEKAQVLSEINENELKGVNQLSQLERSISANTQELEEFEARRSIQILSPVSGVVTSIDAVSGTLADTVHALAAIQPDAAELQAELYVPTSAVGFLKVGDRVILRYPAYPYQKFGYQVGTVFHISPVAVMAEEMAGMGDSLKYGKQPAYKLIVKIEQKKMQAYGEVYLLRAGTLVEADVLQESRYLYEWLLDPLLSITGKF